MPKITKAQSRKRIQEAIGKLAMAREGTHLSQRDRNALWKMHNDLMNIASRLK